MPVKPSHVADRAELAFWRCPACKTEGSVQAGRVKTGLLSWRSVVFCNACDAEWGDLSEQCMTLTEGPEELLGEKSMEEWFHIAGLDRISLEADDSLKTKIILKKGERPILQAMNVSVLKEKTTRVRTGSGGGYSGFSIPLFRTGAGAVRMTTGSFRTPATYAEKTEIVRADTGEFLLTNQRLVFSGARKPIVMALDRIVSTEHVMGRVILVSYGEKAHQFELMDESPQKWLSYISGACSTLT